MSRDGTKSKAHFHSWYPSDRFDSPRDPIRCAYTVYDKWRIDVRGHQCTRQGKQEVDGLLFCAVHFKMVQP